MSRERTLRILLSPSAYHPNVGGIEEATRRLARALQARGHDVVIVTNRWPAETAALETVDGVAVHRLQFELPGASPRGIARTLRRGPGAAAGLVRLVRRHRSDVVHVIGAGPNGAYVVALRRLLRVPVVLSVHGELSGDAHRAFERSVTLRRALAALCRRAASVTAPSAYTLAELGARFRIAGPTAVIANGVDVAEFADAEPRGDLGRYVLAVGRLVEQKGLDTLIEAYAAVRPRLDGRRLVIAGDGPERARLVDLARSLGLEDAVLFLGSVEHAGVARLLRGADAFVLPSRSESFPLAPLEAMAAGTPVIAGRVGGVPELARDGEAALLVPPDDAQSLGVELVRLLDDPELQRRLVAAGRREAAGRSWERMTDEYEAIYRSVSRP